MQLPLLVVSCKKPIPKRAFGMQSRILAQFLLRKQTDYLGYTGIFFF